MLRENSAKKELHYRLAKRRNPVQIIEDIIAVMKGGKWFTPTELMREAHLSAYGLYSYLDLIRKVQSYKLEIINTGKRMLIRMKKRRVRKRTSTSPTRALVGYRKL